MLMNDYVFVKYLYNLYHDNKNNTKNETFDIWLSIFFINFNENITKFNLTHPNELKNKYLNILFKYGSISEVYMSSLKQSYNKKDKVVQTNIEVNIKTEKRCYKAIYDVLLDPN